MSPLNDIVKWTGSSARATSFACSGVSCGASLSAPRMTRTTSRMTTARTTTAATLRRR